MKIYIDFDGTLFDSTIQYQRLINILKKYNISEDYIKTLMKEDFYKKEKSYDILATKIIEEKKINSHIQKEINSIYTKDLVYPDVIPFLEKYSKKYDLILLTLGNIQHQEKKIKSSELKKYFKDIIITDKDKSKLNIDYTKGIFIDNNPKELEKFYNSKAAHLIRIKRNIDKYSKIPLNIENIPEFKNFEELTKNNYIEKIGENYE
ncbi:MAG: HAD hydrolase-like protein [Bacilli bacterium]|nr:HAD hydrolase-like protein [Bacilli bacterium]